MVRLMRNERGFSLIEVIIALALLGIIAVVFLGGLATASKAILVADVRTTAESLARSQMEYVKSQNYSTDSWSYTVTSLEHSSPQQPSWWDDDNPPLLSSNYAGYSVGAKAEDFDVDNDGDIDADDEDIRLITVTIKHGTEQVITLEDYKVDR